MSLGTEKLTGVVRTLAQLITSAIKVDTNKDGKIDTVEIFAIVQFFVVKIVSVYGSFDQAIAELKDLTHEERTELVKVFNEEFDLTNDQLEQLLEEWLLVIDKGVTLSSKTASLLKPKQ